MQYRNFAIGRNTTSITNSTIQAVSSSSIPIPGSRIFESFRGDARGSSATTHGTKANHSRTTYCDASGRVAGSADTSNNAGSGSRTQFRDASGRSAGSETTSGNGTMAGTRRDASGRLTGNSTGTGKCQGVVRVPAPPAGA